VRGVGGGTGGVAKGYEELREKYVGVLGKYCKLKGKFSTSSAKRAEMHCDLE